MSVTTNDLRWFLPHDRELGKLIAGVDWKGTSLGPIDGWSTALRHALALMLRADTPMAMFHGRDGILLYNDAYRAIVGQRHPAVLGQPVTDAWPELAAFNRDVLDVVFAGRTLSYQDIDYSPLVAEDGAVVAVIVFTREAPSNVPHSGHTAEATGNVADGSAARILVVEDDWLVRTTLAEMLQVRGHEVREASDGTRALELLAEAETDLLITDVGLPGMSGVELAAAARARYPHLAVIFATGHANAEGVLTDERSGVLVKPFGSDALTKAVSRLLTPAHRRLGPHA